MPRLAALFLPLTALPAMAQESVCFCARCLLGTHVGFRVPAESMAPSILPGDCLEARYLLPTDPAPAPGDIVVFRHPARDELYVKRIVALAGQSVQMIDGRLHIDGSPVGMQEVEPFVRPFIAAPTGRMPVCSNAPVPAGDDCIAEQWIETLPNGTSYPILDVDGQSRLDNTPLMTVPDGHVFVLGDHRDNSWDSRIPLSQGGMGFVPLDTIGAIVAIGEAL